MSLRVQSRPLASSWLAPGHVDEFFSRGYVLLEGVFSAEEVKEMRNAFDRLERIAYALGTTRLYRGSQFVLDERPRVAGMNAPGGVAIERIVWCGSAEPVLSHYGRDARLLGAASQLLGATIMNQLINQAHYKLPGDGVAFPWHQDSTHRRFGSDEWHDVNGRGSYVQTVTAIDDVTAESGPMQFIPGSCRLGHLGLPEHGRLPEGLASARGVETLTMSAGSVLLFGPYTIHRSGRNDSDLPRRAFLNGFASPGANSRAYPGDGAGRLLAAPRL